MVITVDEQRKATKKRILEAMDDPARARLERAWADPELAVADIYRRFRLSSFHREQLTRELGPKPKPGRMPEAGVIRRRA